MTREAASWLAILSCCLTLNGFLTVGLWRALARIADPLNRSRARSLVLAVLWTPSIYFAKELPGLPCPAWAALLSGDEWTFCLAFVAIISGYLAIRIFIYLRDPYKKRKR